MERIALLSARRYGFQDDGGRRVEGVTLVYVTGDQQDTADQRGAQPLTVTAPLDLFASLRDVPGIYAADFKQRPGPKGRPTLQVTGLTFEAPVDLGID